MILIDNLKQKYPDKSPTGKQLVLRYRHEIEEALHNGFSRQEIYNTLKERQEMPIRYHSFNRHLRELRIGQNTTRPSPTGVDTQPETAAHAPAGSVPVKPASEPHETVPKQAPAASAQPGTAGSGPRTYEPKRTAIVRNVHALSDQCLSGIHRETTT